MADKMLPFRQLLKPGTPFFWDEHINRLFEESKSAIISKIEEGIRIFDKSKPTCLATDWSKTGIGFWLFQKHCSFTGSEPFCCNTGWRITLVGTRFTHPAESHEIAAIKNNTISLPPATSFLSGIHHSDLESDATEIDNNVILSAVSSLDSLAVRSVTWDRVRTATASDDYQLDWVWYTIIST
ncbi:unnamed protein product [Mytilus coruscus]|uniref:Reverse transcriptase/retrotransposon-derived protein RNase H-like domain-containing protein n=1 Tax=Mytilus coruscus TaxID=42192 RepID=A0A6J8DBJ2_MYTCO|nr:unnamed protein product [Mytilus coruscus]